MSQKLSLGKALFGSGAIVALGWGIMKATTPTEQQFYDKLSPDLKREVDLQRQAASRKAALAEQLARAKHGQDDGAGPVWAAQQARDSTPPPRR